MKYASVLDNLKAQHADIMQRNIAENPALIGEALIKLRQTANLILPFINQAIDHVSQAEADYAEKRQALYEEQLAADKSPGTAQTHAREMTRKDEARVAIAKNEVYKLKNDFERFSTLALALQSRLREHSTDKIMEGKT